MARAQNLNAVLYFECVARRGTISRAAEELSVSPSAVSQQVKQLEQRLGVRLFRRDGRRLSLTLEGQLLYQTSSAALRMLRDGQRSLSRARVTRSLSLRVTPSFGVRWLGPRLHDFIARHPEWELRIDAAPDPTDFDRELMDLDIRYGSIPEGDGGAFHTQTVLNDYVLPLCSPNYLASLGSGKEGGRLGKARLIESARALCQWDAWRIHTGFTDDLNDRSVLMDRSSMALQLALDGAGVVLESLALADSLVADGLLVPVLPSVPALKFPAYSVHCPPRHLKRRAVRLFLDWLETQTQEHENSIEKLLDRLGLSTREAGMDIGPAAEPS